jgi:hypothetical protein
VIFALNDIRLLRLHLAADAVDEPVLTGWLEDFFILLLPFKIILPGVFGPSGDHTAHLPQVVSIDQLAFNKLSFIRYIDGAQKASGIRGTFQEMDGLHKPLILFFGSQDYAARILTGYQKRGAIIANPLHVGREVVSQFAVGDLCHC